MASSWRNVALGDVVTLGKGGVWGQDDPGVGMLEAVCLRGTDLSELVEGRIPEAPRRWITESELRKAQCHHNMVLIETSGSRCGRSKVLTNEILSSFPLPVVYSNFCRTLAIDTNHLDSKYVEMWFSFQYEVGVIPSYRATSAMPNLDIKSLLRIERLALPPLQDQKRIVDVVSAADEYIAALQRQVDAARTARNAVLHELLTAGGDDWTATTLGEIATLVSRGRAPSYSDVDGVLVVNQKCIRDGRINFQLGRLTDDKQKPIPDWAYLQLGDSLINSTGTGTLGRAGWIRELIGPATCDSHVTIVRPEPSICFPPFIGLSLNSRESDLEMLAGGSTGQTELSREAVRNFRISIPPLDEQNRIVEIVLSMDEVIHATESAIVESKNLRSGLLSDLLSGEHEIPASYDRLLGAA